MCWGAVQGKNRRRDAQQRKTASPSEDDSMLLPLVLIEDVG